MTTLFGTDAQDNLTGTVQGDVLYGSDGNDFLFGDAGDDFLSGDAGSNTLDGGAGRDVLLGGGSGETLVGGADADCFYFVAPAVGERAIADFNLLEDFIMLNADAFGCDISQFSYDFATGALNWNGTASTGEMLVAQLDAGLAIDANNIGNYVCMTNNITGNASAVFGI